MSLKKPKQNPSTKKANPQRKPTPKKSNSEVRTSSLYVKRINFILNTLSF